MPELWGDPTILPEGGPTNPHISQPWRGIIIRARETTVEGSLEDCLASIDKDNALAKYACHFNLIQQNLDRNNAQTTKSHTFRTGNG